MAADSAHPLLRYLHRLAGSPSEQASDSQLLQRFLADRDEAAFASLVRRHGPMVFALCRRILHDEHDAEDAFQATFLVLARKAASVRHHRSLGGWLHEVAYHLALRAKAKAAQRRKHETEERTMTPADDPAVEAVRRELRSLLDEELRQLPSKYRQPLILCYLEGKTNEQAAQQLGWPLGSMSRRLARGRELLRRRLVRRGVSLSMAALTAALLEETATVPALLAASVVRMMVRTSVIGVPASVMALVEGRMREMFLLKLRMTLLAALTAVCFTAGTLAYPTKSAAPAEQNAAPPSAAKAKPENTDLYGDPLPPGALARLGTTRLRHVGSQIAFSSDGKTLLSFSRRDKAIRLWNPSTGRERRRIALEGAERLKPSILWAWNEKIVGVWTEDQLVLWDASTGRQHRRIELNKANVQTLAVAPDGATVAATVRADKEDALRMWDTASGAEQPRLESSRSPFVYELIFSPNGKLLGARSVDAKLRLWDLSTRKQVRTISDFGRQLSFSTDAAQVASIVMEGREGVVKIWSVEGRERAVLPKIEGMWYDCLRFSPDNKILAVGGRDVLLFDVASRKLLQSLSTWGISIAFAPDGKTLASASFSALHLWDAATGREIALRASMEGMVSVLEVAPDGRRLVSLSPYDAVVRVWDVAGGKPLAALPAGANFRELHIGAMSSDGKRFATGGSAGKVRIWDVDTAKEVQSWTVDLRNAQGVQNPEIIALHFASQDQCLAAVSMAWPTRSGSVKKFQIDLWDIKTGKNLAHRPLLMEIWPVCFDAEGRTLVFRVHDGFAVQDVGSGREWLRLSGEGREPFAVSPDGQLLAATVYEPQSSPPADPKATDARAIVLMELASGKQLQRIDTGPNGFRHLAFSPDGRTLATTDDDGFRVWDVAADKELLRRTMPEKSGFRGYPFTTSLRFLPDNGRLATGLMDGTVLIWDLQPKTWHAGLVVKDLERRDLERLWTDLAGDDAAKAQRAVWTLAALPHKAVPFLKEPSSSGDGVGCQTSAEAHRRSR
jgi:RNA polymerase sigma factor (sigma-70 family)